MEEANFPIRPPDTEPNKKNLTRSEVVEEELTQMAVPIPSVWAQIRNEQTKMETPHEPNTKKSSSFTRTTSSHQNAPQKQNLQLMRLLEEEEVNENPSSANDYGDLLDVRSKIETLLDEHQSRATENETNLIELRLVLENLQFEPPKSQASEQIEQSSHYMDQVQNGQDRLQESISYLIKGAAQLFMQKKHS